MTSTRPEVPELLERGCSLNDAEACLQVAQGLLRRPGQPDAIARGREILTRSCERGAGRACMPLAEDLGRDFKPDEEPPVETQLAFLHLFEQGCSGGDPEACFIRSSIARRGSIGDLDLNAAKRWLEAGCKLDPTGGTLGVSLRFGSVEPGRLAALNAAGCDDSSPPQRKRPALCGPGTRE